LVVAHGLKLRIVSKQGLVKFALAVADFGNVPRQKWLPLICLFIQQSFIGLQTHLFTHSLGHPFTHAFI